MAPKVKSEGSLFNIQPIVMSTTGFRLLGTSPLIMNRYASKAKQALLFPEEKKNKAAKREHLKHDPLAEFRDCMYRNRSDSEPTLLHFPQGAFSKAMAFAALDVPGASKAEILRLVSIASLQVNIYGTPMLGMDMVRSSNTARTPDVRTRAYLPEWCCEVTISYPKSLIGPLQVLNLLTAAGYIVGLGDYRPQKGGAYGRFTVVDPNGKDEMGKYKLVQKQARTTQQAAFNVPDFFDDDSRELYEWFISELERREKTTPSGVTDLATARAKRGNGKRKRAA
jgi:uncharacterized protein YnzC (UPF0291/DUF896 family)